jgi:putative xylitol transport system ATP-binding protein
MFPRGLFGTGNEPNGTMLRDPSPIHLSIQLHLKLNKAGLWENRAESWALKEYFNLALDRDVYYVYKSSGSRTGAELPGRSRRIAKTRGEARPIRQGGTPMDSTAAPAKLTQSAAWRSEENRTTNHLISAIGVARSFSGVPALLDGRIELRRGSVHALCGGNGAGKSTFLNILMGLLRPDAGTITCKGRVVRYLSASDAISDGISIITQELSPVLDLSVAENIYLGRQPRRGGWFVDARKMVADAEQLLRRLRFDIDPRAKMRGLSLAQLQLVEIAKAFSRESDIIIMDEPTSAIGERETDILFSAIRSLQVQGVGILYVSHRLTDIFSVADRYTVFRDGRFVESGDLAHIDRRHLISLIVGRTLVDQKDRNARKRGEVLLSAKGYSRAGQFEDISIDLHRGEIVGLYGLMGAGRSEFANAVYGSAPKDTGALQIQGRRVEISGPRDALAQGIAIVTEDRKDTGLVLTSSVGHNITLPALRTFARFGFVDGQRELISIDGQIGRFGIKAASRDAEVRALSGGNQQKVVFARCIETAPRILICDEPTRGIDEGSKREIYAFLSSFTAAGNAVLMISSDIQEILANADRIIVFRRGRMAGEVQGVTATQENLVHMAS